jgi:hypothetical protein
MFVPHVMLLSWRLGTLHYGIRADNERVWCGVAQPGWLGTLQRCLETYLRCFAFDMQNQWAQWLPLAEWWYNTSYHTTTCMTPLEVVYRQKTLSVLSYIIGVSKVQEVEKNLTIERPFSVP